jgi:hypothetical protein
MPAETLELLPGPGGWVQVVGKAWIVRFTREGDVWKQTEIRLIDARPEDLRAFPLRRIELAVNASDALSAALAARLDEDPEELGPRAFEGFVIVIPEPPITLKRPKAHRLTDEWYAEVAKVYRLAAARQLNPRTTIAEAAGVSTDVAGRWVYEARKRGHLPPAQPGKVSV